MTVSRIQWLVALCASVFLSQCATSPSTPGNMGGGLTEAERAAQIASEPTGDFFYARRYFVNKTRFWGYVRKPRQPWSKARLVILKEDRKTAPDRLPENGPAGQRYGYDQNYEYRLRGSFTGREAYDPNSNQFLPEFRLTGYEVVNRQPGWLFSPSDRYDPYAVSLVPR